LQFFQGIESLRHDKSKGEWFFYIPMTLEIAKSITSGLVQHSEPSPPKYEPAFLSVYNAALYGTL
jgi:hypothetical protein